MSSMYEIAKLDARFEIALAKLEARVASNDKVESKEADLADLNIAGAPEVEKEVEKDLAPKLCFWDDEYQFDRLDVVKESKKISFVEKASMQDIVDCSSDDFNKLLADDLERYRLKFRLKARFNELYANELTVQKFASADKKIIYAWRGAVEKTKLHWVEFRLPSAGENAFKSLKIIEKDLDKLMPLWDNFEEIELHARKQFGYNVYGVNYAEFTPIDPEKVKAWHNIADPLRTKLPTLSQCINPSGKYSISYVAQRVRRYAREREHPACPVCGVNMWRSMHVYFRTLNNGVPANPGQCRECFVKRIKEQIKKKKDMSVKSFYGESRKDFVFAAPNHKSMYQMSNNHWQLLHKRLDMPVKELQELVLEDCEVLVVQRLEEIQLTLEQSMAFDKKEIQQFEYEVNTLSYLDGYTCGATIPAKMRQRNNIASSRCQQLVREGKMRNYVLNVQKLSKDAMEKRRIKDYSGMYSDLEKLMYGMQTLKSNSTFKELKPGFCGYNQMDWVNMILENAMRIFQVCVETAKRCSVCMEVKTGDSDILFTHEPNFDISKFTSASKSLPCMACQECFDNYLKYSSALGKPELKCPAMNCGKHLDEEEVEKLSPIGLANYRSAILKYKMKQCHNFKFCPNSSCGHGFEVLNSCALGDSMQCPMCNIKFCPSCSADPHPGMSCEENKKQQFAMIWGALEGEEHAYMKNESKQCPFCLVWIEKNGGCNHMTCHHCRGEFCWLCFGNWRGHSSCQKPIPVVRGQFAEIVPWVRWPTKESVRIQHQIDIELQYHSQLAYKRFTLGWVLDGDADGDDVDEIRVTKVNPKYEGEDEPQQPDNWELDIYDDDWDESDDEFEWREGTVVYILPVNRYIRKAKIIKENNINEILVEFEKTAYPREWIRKNSPRIFFDLPPKIRVNQYVTYDVQQNYHNPPVVEPEPEPQPVRRPAPGPPPAAPPPAQQQEQQQSVEAADNVEPSEAEMQEENDLKPAPMKTENSVGGDELSSAGEEKDGGGAAKVSEPAEDVKAPEPKYIIEWVAKELEDCITQQNYFSWIKGWEVIPEACIVKDKRDPADRQSEAAEDKKAEGIVEVQG